MTQIVVRLKRWAAQWPILVIPGNHDMPHNRLDQLKYTPFGVLLAAGILTPVWGKAWRHPDGSWVGGVPYPPEESNISSWALEKGPGVLLVHGFASQVGGEFFGEKVLCYTELAQRIPNAVAFVFGHDHRDSGVWMGGDGKAFIQVGALLRGTLTQDQVTRQPKIVMVETLPEQPLLGSPASCLCNVFDVPIKPDEEVFDLAKKAQVETIETQIDQYVTELAKATAARGASVIDLGDLDITDDVRSRVKKYLEKGGVLRLSYTLAEVMAECPKKGQAMRQRKLPPVDGSLAIRRLIGYVVDRVVAIAYEEKWWDTEPDNDAIQKHIDEALKWVLVNEQQTQLSGEERVKIASSFAGLFTLVSQMRDFQLIPTSDLRVQAKLTRPYTEDIEMLGVLDLMVNDGGIVSVLDVKAGLHRSANQLGYYLYLLEAYKIIPHRIGFWMPLRGEIDWRVQSRLPNIIPMVETAIKNIRDNVDVATPGRQCDICTLLSTCDEGLKHKATQKVANEAISGLNSGVTMVGFHAR